MSVLVIILLPLFGWWLIRTTRSYERLAAIVNEHDVELGFLSFTGRASAVLLFSDPTFVFWLLGKKYEQRDLPPPVMDALHEARRSYLLVLLGFAVFLLLSVGLTLST